MIQALDLIGTFVFALSGAFRAIKYELDLLGVLVLASVTGVAGGVIRDVILGATPPSAMTSPEYIIICLFAGLLVFYAAPKIATKWTSVRIADAIGLGVFTAIGANKAALHDATALTIVFMGVLTACGGGVVRDLFVKEIPSVLKNDFYASAAIFGGLFFIALGFLDISESLRLAGTIGLTSTLRLLAMKYQFSLPKSKSLESSPSQIAREKRHRK